MSILEVKYCDSNTLSEVPKYANLQWPNDEDSEDESSEEDGWEDDEGAEESGDEDKEIEVVEEVEVKKAKDMPKIGQVMGDFCDRTSDLGFPVSEEGRIICEYIEEEIEKRDQDSRGMYIYNDWNGWGIREVWENLIRKFNRDIFNKTISPYKKYAYIEGVAAFVKTEDLTQWIGNEDGDSVKAVADFLGVMTLTTYDMLKESNLLVPSTLDTKIKNLETIALLLIEFLVEWGVDLECQWGCEVVRCFDEAGIDLTKSLRKQIAVSKDQIADFRDEYRDKAEASDHAEEEDDGNGYATFAKMDDWKPKDDCDEDGRKMFYRWDWEKEYKLFRKDHPGGKHYVLAKKTKRDWRRR